MSGPYVPKLNDQKASTWELNYKYTFFFKLGRSSNNQTQLLKTPAQEKNILHPIHSKRQYRYPILKNLAQKQSSMTGTLEGVLLHKQLLKECQKTSKLIHLSNLMTQKHQKRKERSPKHSKQQKTSKKKSRNVSSHSAKSLHAKNKQKTSSSSSSSSSFSSTSSRETSSNSSHT